MINFLEGTIIGVEEQKIILAVAGIGFAVYTPQAMGFSTGQLGSFHIHFYWNQEQGPSLYGFASPEERAIFSLIIGCSGMGPKIGLAVLNGLTPSSFAAAISTGDAKTLSSINGIGLKKAESLILQLKDKIAQALKQGVITPATQSLSHITNISQALEALGYSRSEITRALEQLKSPELQSASFDLLMRRALTCLAKKGSQPAL